MKYQRLLASLLAALLVTGCGASAEEKESSESKAQTLISRQKESSDESYDEKNSVKITFSGDTAECSGKGVSVSSSSVAISEGGTFVLAGTLNNGTVTVNCDDPVHLVLNNANLTSKTGPALYVQNAEKVTLTAYAGTKNTITSSGENADEKKGGIYSKDDLVINGSGELVVNGEDGDGIHGNDHVEVSGAILAVTAGNDGIDANETLTVTESILNITAGKDGLKAGSTDDETDEIKDQADVILSGGVVNITSEDDGISSTRDIQVLDTGLSILAGGGYQNGESHTENNGNFFGGFRRGENRDEEFEDWPQYGFEDFYDEFRFDEDFGDIEDFIDEFFREEDDSFEDNGIRRTAVTESETKETSSAKGIKAEGAITLSGTITINASDDAVNTSGSLTVDGGSLELSSGDDALHADDTLTINSGTVTVKESYEGIEATTIVFNDGTVVIKADDDGINSANKLSEKTYGMNQDDGSSITINGGSITIDSGADGIDSNGSITMNDGELQVFGPENSGNGAIDYAGSFTVNKGTLIAGGSAGMAMAPSSGSVGMIRIGMNNPTARLEVRDSSGNVILSYESSKNHSDVVIASDKLVKGNTYTVYEGSDQLGSAEISDTLSRINSNASGSGFGGNGFNRPGGNQQRPDSGQQPFWNTPGGSENTPPWGSFDDFGDSETPWNNQPSYEGRGRRRRDNQQPSSPEPAPGETTGDEKEPTEGKL